MEPRERRYKKKQEANRRKMRIGGAVLLFLLAVFLIITLSIQITITPVGGMQPLELIYGQDTYVEEGAIASCNGERLEVQVKGSVDMTKLGTYEITYTARHLWVSKSVTREVKVVDKTAPVITLKTYPNYFPTPGEEYQEEGYTAIDDWDGNLTDQVQVRRDGDVIYYTVSDSSGNETTVQRNVLRKDQTAPVITLKGETSITIQAGAAFTEPGYTAVDNRDGDVTDKVKITGSVNIYRADTYVLTYTVTDSFGNTASAQRTVVVKPIEQPPVVNPDGKVIYLTFDDGPSRHTEELLKILDKYNAKATFFVVDTGYNTHSVLNAIVDGGHSIAIHTQSHIYEEIYASEEAFFKDLYAMQKLIKDHTGVTTTMMRFPGGSSNTVSRFNPGIMSRLTKAVEDQGFQYFDWNWDSGDSDPSKFTGTLEENAARVAQNIIKGIGSKKQVVTLQHDIYDYSIAAVEEILIWGLQNGYSFQALTPNSPVCHHKVKN